MRWSMLALFALIVVVGLLLVGFTVMDVSKAITLGLDLRGGFEILYQVIPIDENQTVDADLLQATYTALSRRVNAMEVSEPDLRIEGNDRIRVRLAGVHDPDEARRFLATEAQLSFRNTEDERLFGGEHLKQGSAKAGFNELNLPVVVVEFSDPDLIGQISREYLGKQIVIWLDFEEGVDSYEKRL